MSGLCLIKETYSSDTDEDECDEKEQGDDSVNVVDSPNVESIRLALPRSISSWKGVEGQEEDVIDDPSNHDGRTRTFKHERGNWATLIYINYAASDRLCAWIDSTLSKLSISGKRISDLHVSLSRTLVLKFHWIQSFAESLKQLCHKFDRFVVRLTDVRVYRNEEKTRTFLGIHCRNDDGTLQRFIVALNDLLAEYQLPSFYEDNSYHVSFFWCLGDQQAYLSEILPSLTDSLDKFLADNTDDTLVRIDQIRCKIGNKYYAFRLR